MKTSLNRASALDCALQSGTLKGALCALLATTCLASPAFAQTEEIAPPVAYAVSPTGVNLQDGRFVHTNEDLSIGSGELGMTLSRFFLGLDTTRSRRFGPNWSHSFDMYVFETVAEKTGEYPDTWTYNVHVVLGASTINFRRDGSNKTGVYEDPDESPIGHSITYSYGTNKYTLTDPDGRVYTFFDDPNSTSWLVESIVHPTGLRHDFTYGASGLKSVFNNAGFGLAFDYDASNRVTKACAINLSSVYTTASSGCPAGVPAATYQYGTYLSGFTDPSGKSIAYEYGSHSNYLTCIRRPPSGPCEISNVFEGSDTTYGSDNRVVSQTTATGESYSYSYNRPNLTPLSPPNSLPNDRTTVTNPVTGSSVATFLGYKLASQTDPLSRKTDYSFTGTFLTQVTLPEGNIGRYPVDARGNHYEYRQIAKPNTGLADVVRTASYQATCGNPKTCNKPDHVIDARGNRTDFTYDPAHGGVLTETAPAVNGVRPQKRYSYQQRYAYVRDSSGTLVQASSPVWVLAQVAQCQTQASCTGGADEVRTVYEYASGAVTNALLPRGVLTTGNGVSARSCQRYDSNGRAISETGSGANLSSCPAS